MVPALSLWMPILASAVLVFVASSAIHMFLNWHANDFRAAPDEDGLMDALRGFDLPPGNYSLPHAGSTAVQGSKEFQDKVRRGPAAMLTILPVREPLNMNRELVQWFAYCALVGLFAAYVTGRALGPGADYMDVFRIASTTAFMGYSLAHIQDAIWQSQGWGPTARSMADGLIYGLLTGGAFGWLWP